MIVISDLKEIILAPSYREIGKTSILAVTGQYIFPNLSSITKVLVDVLAIIKISAFSS